MKTADYWIQKLELINHPEGGYFKEVYRSEENINKNALPARYSDKRCFGTSIYFLLKGAEFSSFHKISSDETWHFYQGTTLELIVINPAGNLTIYKLGADIDSGEQLQITIPRDHWFGARIAKPGSFALLGCTVAPGFHFDDFELAKRDELRKQFPKHDQIIKEMTFN